MASACVRRPLPGFVRARARVKNAVFDVARSQAALTRTAESAMRRTDGGGADSGATAAELGAGNDCLPG